MLASSLTRAASFSAILSLNSQLHPNSLIVEDTSNLVALLTYSPDQSGLWVVGFDCLHREILRSMSGTIHLFSDQNCTTIFSMFKTNIFNRAHPIYPAKSSLPLALWTIFIWLLIPNLKNYSLNATYIAEKNFDGFFCTHSGEGSFYRTLLWTFVVCYRSYWTRVEGGQYNFYHGLTETNLTPNYEIYQH